MTVEERTERGDRGAGATAHEKAQENESAVEEMRELEGESRLRISTTGPTGRPST